MVQAQQMPDDLHIASAEATRRSMAEDIPLGGVVFHWIRAAEGLKGTLRATREGLHTRRSS